MGCNMKKRTYNINEIKTEKIPTYVKFKCTDGSILKIKATKIIKKRDCDE
jgi:hypothetical protein